jgi:hypothetical protein
LIAFYFITIIYPIQDCSFTVALSVALCLFLRTQFICQEKWVEGKRLETGEKQREIKKNKCDESQKMSAVCVEV